MAQIKMKYGIDLGTTNSAICKMENGEPVIKKTDTLKDTLPSCISFTRRRIIKVGDNAYNDLRQDRSRATRNWNNDNENVFIEFKRTMGLNTLYKSKNMEQSYNSEELSAEVLKTLKSFVSDDNINACVITIPAKFKVDQIEATKRAAKLAGIEHCELLQEPIAASMAYGLTTNKKEGIWLVFDFGGGTFDAALMKVEEGIMQVKDTEGDNYLGGKNLDYAIVDEIIVPYLKDNFTIDEILKDENKRKILRDAMKFYAEQAKNQLSFKEKWDVMSQLDEFGNDDNGEELVLDMIITKEQIKPVLSPIFQKAVNICKELLNRNNLKGTDLDSLILVGGPTYSPILRSMLKEQITENVKTDIDPMTAVARGAALYASGIDSEVKEDIKSGTIALDLAFESNTVETLEFVSVKLLKDECTGNIPDKVFVELTRNDKGWSSGKIEINEIGDVIECQLMEGKANAFTITTYDNNGMTIPCFPNEINIMQGIVVGSAVIPYHIGIEIHDTGLNKDTFAPLKGLEKNKPLPAVGVRNELKIQKQLRPGISDDRLVIPIYQGEFSSEGSSAIYNDHVFDVIITGDDVPEFIPADSDIDITVKVNNSQSMILEATFPIIGETIVKEINVEQRSGVNELDLSKRLEEAKRKLNSLKKTPGVTNEELSQAKSVIEEVENRYENEKNSEDGKMHLLADLRRGFLKIEEIEKAHEWEALESELNDEYDRLEKANNDLGNKYDLQVAELKRQKEQVINKQDVKLGRQVLEDINSLFIKVTFIYQLFGFIRHYSTNFAKHSWKDENLARQLLNKGQDIIATNPSVEKLHPLVCDIYDLLNDDTAGPPIPQK